MTTPKWDLNRCLQPTSQIESNGNYNLFLEGGTNDSDPIIQLSRLIVDGVDQIRQNVNQVPAFINDLVQLGTNEDYVICLEHYLQGMTCENQYALKHQLSEELHAKFSPSLSYDPTFPLLHLGRGRGPIGNEYRITHPVSAIQTFAQLYYLNERWNEKAILGKLLASQSQPQKDIFTRCLEACTGLLGGFAKILPDNPSELVQIDHESTTDALKYGLKIVGPPGLGKSALLSIPTYIAVIHEIPFTIIRSWYISFSTISVSTISFTFPPNQPFSATISVSLGKGFKTDDASYSSALLFRISQLPRDANHLLLIDPLEKENSKDILTSFYEIYQVVSIDYPNIFILSAHSTPYLQPVEQSKRGRGRPDALLNLGHLQFFNMNLSHYSLQKLFSPFIEQKLTTLHPGASQDDIENNINLYFRIAQICCVPTIRHYMFFFALTKDELEIRLKTQIYDVNSDQYIPMSYNINHPHPAVRSEIADPWIIHSVYSDFNTDLSEPSCIVSDLVRPLIREHYSITPRFQIDEENAICIAARLGGAKWNSIEIKHVKKNPDRLQAHVTSSTVHIQYIFSGSTLSKQVLGKYIDELADIGARVSTQKNNYMFRLSTSFPVFDFIIVDSSGKAHFISLKTGEKDAPLDLYVKASEEYAKHLGVPTNYDWYVWATHDWFKPADASKTTVYNIPEDIFGVGVDETRQKLLDFVGQCNLWEEDTRFF